MERGEEKREKQEGLAGFIDTHGSFACRGVMEGGKGLLNYWQKVVESEGSKY